MDAYQSFIHKSRYARFIEKENRREEWHETVDRYINYVSEHLSDKYNFNDVALMDKLRTAIIDMDIMPSMRAMMAAGKAMKRDNVAGYNCFVGETEFITRKGVKRLVDLVDQEVEVLTPAGWKMAKVSFFGRQQTQLVTLRPTAGRSSMRHHIKVTPDHRWYTMKGETTALKVGDAVLSNVVQNFKKNDEAWIRGFGFGDGTIDARGQARVRLCGSKNKYLNLFQEMTGAKVYNASASMAPEDHLVIFGTGIMTNWKSLPVEHLHDPDYLASWLSGYMAADGHHDPRQPGLSSQDLDAIDFVMKIAPFCGFVVTGHNTIINDTNYGPRAAPLHRLTLRPETVFYVTAIETLDEAEVYCVTEPETKSFTLANGILTGNCSYLPVDDMRSFDEAMFILLCGTGVGFSVERQYIAKLPHVPDDLEPSDKIIVVEDSKEGWAKSLRELISSLYLGEIPGWDVSRVRPAGSVLKTFGGRASGPEPLVKLFKFVINIFKNAAGRRLTSIECHDIMCMIGDVVVVGGVRRSAMISLSNLSDDRMRTAKIGSWWDIAPWRQLSNNSAVYTERPEIGQFMREWLSLYDSKSGERGIFSREASKVVAARNGRRDANHEFGTNPCSEIILRPYQFCNLTEVIVRAEDTEETLANKVRLATILGTFQSTFTHFPYLRRAWKKNTEDERLLGVSMTGIYDNKLLNNPKDKKLPELLQKLRQTAVDVNAWMAKELGINVSTAITCVKPSGTVSQLTDTASGIHPRHDRYYYRRVRQDIKDPLTQYMIDLGVQNEPVKGKEDSTVVFTFPKKAPKGAVLREDVTAIEHLELWLQFQRHWCEHKPSVTINVKEHEWMAVGAWVYEHFDEVSGISFLPYDGGTYEQAPYEEVTKEQYEELLARTPQELNWTKMVEQSDTTEGVQTLACSAAGGGCEL